VRVGDVRRILTNIRNGKYFDDFENGRRNRRRVIYELRVIEYQHCGLPHAHIVIKLANVPHSTDSIACAQWIDQFLSCELPEINENSSEEDVCYFEAVERHMMHKCANSVNGCLDKHGNCKKGFMDTVIQPDTSFDNKGYAIYKRLKTEDLKVCPHNRTLLLDWDGHAYIDWCASTYTVLYLYKVN
jgi:hypothetical protein